MKIKNEEKENIQFRLRGKKLLLIYYNLNALSIEEIENLILNQLKNKLPKIVQYIISIEEKNDNSSLYYVYLEFNQRVELYKKDYLNLTLDGINYQGEYKTIRKKNDIIRFITRNKIYKAKPELPVIDGEIFLDFKEYLIELKKRNNLNKIKTYLNLN